jgi:hypothetical protein
MQLTPPPKQSQAQPGSHPDDVSATGHASGRTSGAASATLASVAIGGDVEEHASTHTANDAVIMRRHIVATGWFATRAPVMVANMEQLVRP